MPCFSIVRGVHIGNSLSAVAPLGNPPSKLEVVTNHHHCPRHSACGTTAQHNMRRVMLDNESMCAARPAAGNEWNGMDAVTDMRQVVANTFRARCAEQHTCMASQSCLLLCLVDSANHSAQCSDFEHSKDCHSSTSCQGQAGKGLMGDPCTTALRPGLMVASAQPGFVPFLLLHLPHESVAPARTSLP